MIAIDGHFAHKDGNLPHTLNDDKRSAWSLLAKRGLDIVLTVVMIFTFLPVLVGISLVIWLSDGSPILYKHRRVGQHGRAFSCLKFRTMAQDADRRLDEFLRQDPDARQQWERQRKLRHDPRVHGATGEFLRKTSLDELPQLFNVLAGHMSLVGPRPVTQQELPMYGEAVDYYLAAKPGMTGLWQVRRRNDTTFEERVSLDVHYVKRAGLLHDLTILLRTPGVVLLQRGAY